MGDALRAFFQSVSRYLTQQKTGAAPPMVGGHPVDYSALTNEEIAAATPDDELFKQGNWTSVNRRP